MSFLLQKNIIDPKKPVVALTFDDGPGIYTSHILDTLQQCGGCVSFFVLGNKIEEQKSKINRAHLMGCEILCHSWDHPDFTKIPERKMKKQIVNTIAAIAKITGKASLMFRPPYLSINSKVEKFALKQGLAMINCSLAPGDWKPLDADTIYTYIANNIKDGDIILCHDTNESTAAAMERLIPDLLAQGCQLVTVTELLLHKYGKIEPGKLYTN